MVEEYFRMRRVVLTCLTYAGSLSTPVMLREGLPYSWPCHFSWCFRTLLTVWAKLGEGGDGDYLGEAALGSSLLYCPCRMGWADSLSVLKNCHSFPWGRRRMSLTRNLFELRETEAAVWGKASDLRKSSSCFCLLNILVLMTMQAAEMWVPFWDWIWRELTRWQGDRLKNGGGKGPPEVSGCLCHAPHISKDTLNW